MIRRRLNRGWRIAATGFCFAVFGVGSLVLTLIAAPGLWLLVRAPEARKRRAQRVLSAACRVFTGLMRYSGVLHYRTVGGEYLRQPGILIVANHPSLIDAIFLIALMPEVDCVVNERLWRNPFTGGPVRLAGYISNGIGPDLVNRCCARLRAGHRLIIFPEGTRTQPGQALRFQRGAANIAIRAGADVVPVTIVFKQTTLTRGQPWYHVPPKKIDVSISADAPIAVLPYLRNSASQPLAARRLTADLYDYYTIRLARVGRLPEHDPVASAAPGVTTHSTDVETMSDNKPIPDKETLYAHLRSTLIEMFEIPAADIHADAHLYEDLDIDSLDAVDLLVTLRDFTGIQVQPEQVQDVRTVGDMIDTVWALAGQEQTQKAQ